MGQSCERQGNYKRAKGLLKRALAIAELHVVPDQYPHALTRALQLLSDVYTKLKLYDRAQPLAQRVLALDEQFLGPLHPNVGVSLNGLAMLFNQQGKLGEAQPLYERALAICEHVHGPNHTEVAAALANVGILYRQQGNLKRADSALERALAIRERLCGPKHVDTAHSLQFLAACCANTGNTVRAKALFERALSIYDTALGRTHPQTAAILHMLANLATQAGQSRRAAALNERATIAAAAARHQECGQCGRTDVPGSKYCSQCKAVWFCNEQCQKQAWKGS
jgi:tetratricopeptide (TPR) repeat protein